jgi:hypothetical protein
LRKGVTYCNQSLILSRITAEYQSREQTAEELIECNRKMAELRDAPSSAFERNVEGLDWDEIAKKYVPTRFGIDCKIRWLNNDHPSINKTEFSKEEDKKLLQLVQKYDGYDWRAIADELGVRTHHNNKKEQRNKILTSFLLFFFFLSEWANGHAMFSPISTKPQSLSPEKVSGLPNYFSLNSLLLGFFQ